MKTSIMLVDDHAVVREGLRSLLELSGDFEVVAEAASGVEAVALAGEHAPHLVLMDLIMPGQDGVSAIKEVKSVSPASHIAVLTSAERDELAFAALEAGARSFLLKSMFGDDLLATIRRIAKGEAVIHPFIAAKVVKVLRSGPNPVPEPFAALTDRELEVLKELAQGVSNARIAASLFISEKTVKTHISNILGKLNLNDRTEAVAFAWRQGLVKPSDERS